MLPIVSNHDSGLPSGYNPPNIDAIIAAWLDAKWNRTQSDKTRDEYRANIYHFRRWLAKHGRDLDAPESDITPAVQAWAGLPKYVRGVPRAVSAATRNRRLAIVSSFYEYARRNRALHLTYNPVEIVERSKVQAYRGVQSKTPEQVAVALAGIDRRAAKGKRDYALLALALFTGRRVSELANLILGDISGWENEDGNYIIQFRAKGGKIMRDEIPPGLRRVLDEYIAVAYPLNEAVRPDMPLWISFKRTGEPFGIQAIQNLCLRYFGTSKAHILRHTFAMGMIAVGASVPELKERLGHSSLATTTQYVEELTAAKNSKARELLDAFGIRPTGV